MQRAEMEELRQREANMTALQAIGVRKKPKLDLAAGTTGSFNQVHPFLEAHRRRFFLIICFWDCSGAFTSTR